MVEEVDQLTDRELQEDIAKSLRQLLVVLEELLQAYRNNNLIF